MVGESQTKTCANMVQRDVCICDTLGVSAMTRPQCVDCICSLPTTPVSATICFVGVPAVVLAASDPQMKKLYNQATLSLMDGMQIVKTARKMGFDCDRCAGPNIMGLVFAESVRRGMTHYFYGGKDEDTLRKVMDHVKEQYPGIQILGGYVPPYRPLTEEEDAAVCAEINALRPDFVWVGIGAPKQEIWMWQHRKKLQGVRMLGVGAGFDFLAGTLDKAPTWMEDAGIEWLYRLLKEPRRLWKRYILGGVKYLWLRFRHPSYKISR